MSGVMATMAMFRFVVDVLMPLTAVRGGNDVGNRRSESFQRGLVILHTLGPVRAFRGDRAIHSIDCLSKSRRSPVGLLIEVTGGPEPPPRPHR